ncbi:MAG: hypothetical protein ACOYNL_07830 [Rickettsiales bacterium]
MTINLQTGAYIPPQTLPGARSTDIQVAQKQPEDYPEISVSTPGTTSGDTVQSADQQRYKEVVIAARRFTGDPYPVSDKSFTIFKDSSGQYITRFTSLRDGRVTYIPELKLLQQLESHQRALKTVVHLQA